MNMNNNNYDYYLHSAAIFVVSVLQKRIIKENKTTKSSLLTSS